MEVSPDDSGIDSDDEELCPHHHSPEESASEEDPNHVEKGQYLHGIAKGEYSRGHMKEEDLQSDGSEAMIPMVPQLPHVPTKRKVSLYSNNVLEPDRNSPPLYEVELTASDEDDDASVLELVIPVQTSRYQRVPTSSPKRGLRVAPAFFCNLFCCLRK